MNDADFDRMWVIMCRDGSADEFEGVEYTRVKQEWIQAGRPGPIALFIFQHANETAPKTHKKKGNEGA